MAEKNTQKGALDELVTETTIDAASHVQGILQGKVGKPVDIAGEKVDPEVAYENLKEALELVGDFLNFDPNDLYFQKFCGETVGEARGEKIIVDPLMLMHPAARLAHVIAHEKAHMEGDVDLDSLVESYISTLGFVQNDGAILSPKYISAQENFHEFINRIADGKTVDETVEKVFNLYYRGKFDQIYALYDDKYIQKLGTKEEKDEAFAFFKTVFPLLEVTEGEFSTENVVTRATEEYGLTQEEPDESGDFEKEFPVKPQKKAKPTIQ